jgi:hypothetical protein
MCRHLVLTAMLLAAGAFCPAGELPVNQWVELKEATAGQRGVAALIYSEEAKRFLAVGGELSWNAKGDQPYGDLALDVAEGKWENWYPAGKSYGPKFGPCQPPKFKGYYDNAFADVEGTNRANPNAFMWRPLYGCSALDTDAKKFHFHGGGATWSYDPAARKWEGIETATHPAKAGFGPLLWSSMCYDVERKRFVLFGGGNVQTERGDPGTWTFDPAAKAWTELKLEKQPAARALSRLAYDPAAKKVVLFGGDGLNVLYADTWTFDGQKWEEKQPAVSPSPRAGHALLWLPKAKKLLLLGGHGYESGGGYHGEYYRPLPLEAWTYDAAADKWELIRRFENGKAAPVGAVPTYGWSSVRGLLAAVDENDTLAVMSGSTWLCRLDASAADAAGTAKHGVKTGTVERRKDFYDPKWYSEGVPAADPAKVKAELDGLPANQWVRRSPPRVPRPNMDWGSAAFLPKADAIAHFSGGHCAYSGTAPQFYDVKTDRWSIPFVPEFPLDQCCSDGGAPGEWSFGGNPWMPGHTWRTTGSDPAGERLVYVGRALTYSIGPKDAKWSRGAERHPWNDVRATTLCTTGDALVAWAIDPDTRSSSVLYRVDTQTGAWKKLPVTGKPFGRELRAERLPNAVGFDRGGMSWDSKRDRLLIFSPGEKGHAGDVMAYDLKTGEARWLAPAGAAQAGVPARETVYLPEHDLVLLGSKIKTAEGKALWPVYDCEKNAWFGATLAGIDPLGKSDFDVSLGVVYDPNRKLVWAVGQNSELTVLRFDPKAAGLVELK